MSLHLSAAPSPSPLLHAEEVADLLAHRHVVLLEVFRAGGPHAAPDRTLPTEPRTPGAHLLRFEALAGDPATAHPEAGDTPLPTPEQVQRHLDAYGVGPGTAVVVATRDNPTTATRVRWVLRWAGLADVRVLDGGAETWPADATLPPAATETVVVRTGALQTTGADGAAKSARRGLLLDSRPRAAFDGQVVDEPGQRPTGHVPGAVSLPASELLTAGRLRPVAELRTLLAPYVERAGDQPLVVQCGSGVAATLTALALELVGHEAVLHPASWSGWVADPSRPVEKSAPACG